MGSVPGFQMNANELRDALKLALEEDARLRERSVGRAIGLAIVARGLPTETVDRAFADAVKEIVQDAEANWAYLQEILVIAEQFADRAGGDRFSRHSRQMVLGLVAAGGGLSYGEKSSAHEIALCRAYALTLAKAVGVSLTLDILRSERELQKLHPLHWLDLARTELPAAEFVSFVDHFLQRDAFHPFELVAWTPLISRQFGAGVTQEVLDVACRKLYTGRHFDEARELIARAESVEPRGWRLPLGGEPIIFPAARPVDDYIAAFLRDFRSPEGDVLAIVESLRDRLDPLLATSSDEKDEAQRNKLRQQIFTALRKSPMYRLIQITGILPDFWDPDDSDRDWWQDLGPWREDLPKKDIFERTAKELLISHATRSADITRSERSSARSTKRPKQPFKLLKLTSQWGKGLVAP